MTVAEYKTERITSRKAAEILRSNIVGGFWRSGQRVPTIRNLADKVGTSTQTIQNALRIIEGEGLLQRKEGRTAVVSNDLQELQSPIKPKVSLKQIGVLFKSIPDASFSMQESWSSHIFFAFRERLFNDGYELVIMPYPEKEEGFNELIKRGLDGFLFMLTPPSTVLTELMSKSFVPWVCLLSSAGDEEHNVVRANNFAGANTLGKVFIRLKYEKILVLAKNFEGVSDSQKATGIINAYLRAGKNIESLKLIAANSINEQAGYEHTKKYLQDFGKPDAIFATGDWLAKGACNACQEAGFNIGQDVAVVGATGLEIASHYHPPLSVLRQPMEEMGQGAAEMLLEMIVKKTVSLPSRSYASKLIIRDSLIIPDDVKVEIDRVIGS